LNQTARPGEVAIRRHLNPARTVVVAEGEFSPLFAAYREHVSRWELPTDDLIATMMREGLAALALHLSTRPPDETLGITLNIPTPPLNLFVAGDAGTATVTGRVFTEAVKTAETGRMFVQAFRPHTGPSQSSIEVAGLDVLGMFEAFYRLSEQSAGRLFDLDGDRFVLVRALPDASPAEVENLDRDGARALLEGDLEPVQTTAFRLWCGCNPARILGALQDMFGPNPEDLFQGDPEVETFCPRCGARWWITREEFAQTPPSEAPPPPGGAGAGGS
jgi:hypothetical protein